MDFMHLSSYSNKCPKWNGFQFVHIFKHFDTHDFRNILRSASYILHYKYFLHVIRLFVFLFFSVFSVLILGIKTPLPVWHAIWDYGLRRLFHFCFVWNDFFLNSAQLRCSISLNSTENVKRMLTRAFSTVHHHKSRYFVFDIARSMWSYLCSSDVRYATQISKWKQQQLWDKNKTPYEANESHATEIAAHVRQYQIHCCSSHT